MTRDTRERPPARARRAPVALLLFVLFAPRGAHALDAVVLGGTADSIDTDETTYAWQIDFRHNFRMPLAASAAWINEGHFRDHHRDGLALELWGRIPLAGGRVSLAFGAGAYRFFDTRPLPGGAGHLNIHGTAPIYSLSASWFTRTPLFARFLVNHIHPAGEVDTNAFLVGVGYRLGPGSDGRPAQARPGGEVAPRTTGTELTALIGTTIRNSLQSNAGAAGGLELRRGLSRNVDWTLSWIHEDNPEGLRRSGLGSQLWLVDAYARNRLVLGLGGGLYTFYDRSPPRETHSRIDFAGLLSLTAGYRFSERWTARIAWNRTMTENDRDSDIVVIGAGVRWDE